MANSDCLSSHLVSRNQMRQSIVTYLCSLFEYANFPFSYCIIVRMYHCGIEKKTKDNTHIHGLTLLDGIQIWIRINTNAYGFVSGTGLKPSL